MAAFLFLLRRGQFCKQPPYTVKYKFISRIGYGLKKVKVLSPRLFDVEERGSLVCCVSWIHVWCGRHERRRTLLRKDEPMKHSRGCSEVCSLSLVGSSLSLHPKFTYTHTHPKSHQEPIGRVRLQVKDGAYQVFRFFQRHPFTDEVSLK